jgi:hypothetical protein
MGLAGDSPGAGDDEMASSAVLEGIGTLVCSGERFPNMHYKMSVERAEDGFESTRGMIETLPQRASVQIGLEGTATLELQSGEAIGITFHDAALRRLNAEFIATGPVAES